MLGCIFFFRYNICLLDVSLYRCYGTEEEESNSSSIECFKLTTTQAA
jgi:hypothetical protein